MTLPSEKSPFMRGFLIFVIVLVILFVLNLVKVYTSLFQTQVAFVYHHTTDSFFIVDLEPILSPIYQWEYLIPFKSLKYGQAVVVNYKGKLSLVLKQREKYYQLINKNPDLFSEKLIAIKKLTIESIKKLQHKLEFSSLHYWPHLELDPSPLVPAEWKSILTYIEKGKESVFVADVLFMKIGKEGPYEITPLNNSIVIKGHAAGLLRGLRFDRDIEFNKIW